MYANAETLAALPCALDAKPPDAPGRRHHIGDVDLSPRGLQLFNDLLVRLGRANPLDCDQIVTAARSLMGSGVAEPIADCIAQRLVPAGTLGMLLEDRHWAPTEGADPPLRLVRDYVLGSNDLIPDWLPKVGRLDDAIVIDAAWVLVYAEVSDYRDYRRLKVLEAQLRGRDPAGFRFNRQDWEESRHAERALQRHQRQVRDGSYVNAATVCFRVH